MAVELTREQRGAVRDEVVCDLSGIGDLTLVIDRDNVAEALRLRERFVANVWLLDDLGWAADDPRERFELTLAGDQLERALEHLQGNATAVLRQHVLDPADCEMAERAAIASDAYDTVIREIQRGRTDKPAREPEAERLRSPLAE